MLTKLEEKIVHQYTYYSTITFTFPFDWDEKTKRISTTNSKTKYYGVCLNCTLSALYSIFLIVRFIPGFGYDFRNILSSNTVETGTVALILFHSFSLLVQLCTFTLQLNSLLYAEEWAFWYNQLHGFKLTFGKLFKYISIIPKKVFISTPSSIAILETVCIFIANTGT